MEDLPYLDKSHSLLKSFEGVICSGVVKRSSAKRLADSRIGLKELENLWKAHGGQGLVAILAATDVVALNALVNHFKGRVAAIVDAEP